MESRIDIYGGRDPLELPIYSYAAGARMLGIPSSTISWWVKGRISDGYAPVLRLGHRSGLSFLDLIELHALHRLRRVHGVKLGSIREALDFSEKQLNVQRLLLREDLKTVGGEVFIEHLGTLVNLSRGGQIALRKILERFLERVDRGADQLPNQFYPDFDGAEMVDDQRPVAINPRVAFGRPTIAGTRVYTSVVANRVDEGERVEDLAEDYGVSVPLIESAVSYENAA